MNIFKNKEDAKIEKKHDLEKEISEKLDMYKKNAPDVLYCALMKYMNNNYNMGHISIANINEPGIYHNGDILMYSTKPLLNSGDILHLYFYNADSISQHYLKFKSFVMGGNILVQDENGNDHTISNDNVLDVLIKTVPFGDETWEKLFNDFGGDYNWLLNSIKDSLEFWKKTNDSNEIIKNKIIQELENRLKALEAKIGEKK